MGVNFNDKQKHTKKSIQICSCIVETATLMKIELTDTKDFI
jgi:hypothetical protein